MCKQKNRSILDCILNAMMAGNNVQVNWLINFTMENPDTLEEFRGDCAIASQETIEMLRAKAPSLFMD